MIYRDPYVWIDPWAEFERFDDYLEREEEEHHNAMRRSYEAMASENARMRQQYADLIGQVAKSEAFNTFGPQIFMVPT